MKCDICGKIIENSVNYCTFQRYKVKKNGLWNGYWEDAIVCGNCISKVYGKRNFESLQKSEGK